MRHILEQLRQERKRQGLTQQEVADKLGVTNKTVCGWEKGRGTQEMRRLCDWIDTFGLELMLVPRTDHSDTAQHWVSPLSIRKDSS